MPWPKGKPGHNSRGTLAERFWVKVNKDGANGCWLWTGATRYWGYGCIWDHGKIRQAHRVSWELAGRELPPPHLCIDHMCRTPACVNPDHLRVVTYKQNATQNNVSPFARNAQKTHCKHGHEFTPENTAMYLNPGRGFYTRVCLTCIPSYWRWAVVPRSPPPNAQKRMERKSRALNSTGGSGA